MANFMQQQLRSQERIENLFNYEHEDWFGDLTNLEIAFLAGYIELYEKKPQEFLERLANIKEQRTYFNFLQKTAKKAKNKRELVEKFFSQVSINEMIQDVNLIAQTFEYVVDNQVAQYVIGNRNEAEITAYSEKIIQQGKFYIPWKEEKITITVQSVIYFIFANVILYEVDDSRIIGCECDYEEALFAYAYAEALQKENLTSFFILPNSNFVKSTLFATIAFSKSLRFLGDVLEIQELRDNEDFIANTVDQIARISTRRQNVFYVCYTNYLKNKIGKLERNGKQQIIKHNDLQIKLEKQKEKYEQQVEKFQKLKQELNEKTTATAQNQQLEKSLNEEIIFLKKQIKTAKDELKAEQKKILKEQGVIQKEYEKQLVENQSLINNISALQKQLTNEKRQKLPFDELTFEKWLQKGQELLQGLSATEEVELKGFIDLAENILLERSMSQSKSELATNRIGYCRVDEEGHFINFGDDKWMKVNSIPSSIYISNGQFAEVTKDIELVDTFDYYHSEGPADTTIAHFAIVENRHNEAFAKVNGTTKQIKYREGMFIIDKQVISINQHNEFVSYYQNRKITLDDLLPSIQLKNHEPIYVLMALANGYVVRSLDDSERFIQIEEPLLAHSSIILDEKENVQYKDATGLIWKSSSIYKKKLLASVSEIDSEIYVLKSNQEYVQLHDVPRGLILELGDMIWIDEFNRFIEIVQVEENYVSIDTIEKQFIDNGRRVTRRINRTTEVKDKELLIIGNVRLSERYKKYFGEFGYGVEVVDGAGPFEKIRQACSKYNTILYSTAFTSHKNSGKMKKEVSKPFVLCHSTAPRVMHSTLEMIG
ncbi:hypothetical protein [Psychrobacillus sp. BL-248-WT-3]|uniref:hypothetical protein n=1 Tax=Psychrobacillus sp. BL-248-WT-3 TaxID=2725306 RepID=UPI00146CCA23|nr:hypothetical protein [Psychrobacillus sp. BL-248-WT-3]NME06215.1 hypothetical protein [Psychrobacillus sp. BL-248-WT-3]